ncbi:MAG: DUF4199 domain-containing protein, partial [Ferruginibacter sp.]
MTKLTATQKGLLIGIVMIIASVFSLYILKNPLGSYFQFIVYSLFCLGILWSLFSYSRTATEKKAFRDYFSTGFKTFIVVTLLMALFTYVYFSIDTSFRDTTIAENNRLLILQGDHLPNEIAENTKQLKKMFMPLMISSSVFRYLLLGALITVITGGFLTSA